MDALTKKQIRKRGRYFRHRAFSSSALKQKIITWFIFILFLAYAISLIYPFVYLMINSFKSPNEFIANLTGTEKEGEELINSMKEDVESIKAIGDTITDKKLNKIENDIVYYEEQKIARIFKKHAFYKFLKEIEIDWKKYTQTSKQI